jgi:hypothetical protein
MTHWNALGLTALAVVLYCAAGNSNASHKFNPLEQSHEYQRKPQSTLSRFRRLQ